jgi:hypothetical protein
LKLNASWFLCSREIANDLVKHSAWLDYNENHVQMIARHGKRFIFISACVLSGIVVALILCEICVRVWVSNASSKTSSGYVQFVRQQDDYKHVFFRVSTFRKVRDASVGWEPVPNTAARAYRINSSGYRGKEYPKQPPSNTVRIVFLGDSETFAERLSDQETVPGSLEEYLNAKDNQRNYEVVNFGVLGYNTAQEFECLKRKAIHWNPSVVILYYAFNDPEIDTPIDFTASGLLIHSQLYRFAMYSRHSMSSLSELKKKAKNYNEYLNLLHSSVYSEASKSILGNIADYLAARNIKFFLLIVPEIYQVKNFKDAYPYYGIHQKLALLESPKINVVDTLPVFAKRFPRPIDLYVTPFDSHKNAVANQTVAEVIGDKILRFVQKSQ